MNVIICFVKYILQVLQPLVFTSVGKFVCGKRVSGSIESCKAFAVMWCIFLCIMLSAFTNVKEGRHISKTGKRLEGRIPVYTVQENAIYNSPTSVEYVNKRSSRNNLLAPKIGVSISGFTSIALQSYLFKPQVSIMGLYRITSNIGIYTELGVVIKGTRDIQLDLPFGLKKKEPSSDGEDMLVNISSSIKDYITVKKPEYFNMVYINVPLALCLSFKGHPMSLITNHFIMGFYFGYLIDFTRKRYEIHSMEVEDAADLYRRYSDPTNSATTRDTKEIDKTELGYTLGYMFETGEGMLFGIKYSESLTRIFTLEKRDFELRNRNMSIELFFAYNILQLFKR